MKITASNAAILTAVLTALYWAAALLLLGADIRAGDLLKKDGRWVALWWLTGTCGMAYWVMMAPWVVRSFRADRTVRGIRRWVGIAWCFSTLPASVLGFVLICTAVVSRV